MNVWRESTRERSDLWDRFTRREEYDPRFRDRYDRFPHYLSKVRDVFNPEVSRRAVEKGWRPHYPDGKRYAICLTHDIDAVYLRALTLGRRAARALRHGRVWEMTDQLMAILSRRRSPLWNFDEITELESHYDARSGFYFLALAPGDEDFNYDISDLRNVLADLSSGGWEIGLHGGHGAYLDRRVIEREKSRIEDVLESQVSGYRNHYLRFRVPDTWRILQESGFTYDTTFGFPDCVGFRNGVCHPFRPYDLRTDRFLDILELPLILMDCSLVRYMKLDSGTAWELTKSLLDVTASLSGVITLVWHNPYMEGEPLDLYKRILQHGKDTDAWLAPAGDIAHWWLKHDFENNWDLS